MIMDHDGRADAELSAKHRSFMVKMKQISDEGAIHCAYEK